MSKLHIALTVIILTVTPSLISVLNEGVVPGWMVGLAIFGFVVAAVAFFMPTRKDMEQ